MTERHHREVLGLINAEHTLEGGGFPVRRPFPTAALPLFDPFLLLDHIGPLVWKPGEAIGAPDHPHRGFETVSYLLEGRKEHKDSSGHAALMGPGDVQWMTAGSGIIHSEMPEARFRETGGLAHGFQIWVNLPARDKMMPPRYQTIPAAEIPLGEGDGGRVRARVIAGEALGQSAVIDTRTPIMFLHFTIQPGGSEEQTIPADHQAMVYVIAGAVTLGTGEAVAREGQMAVLGEGDLIRLAVPEGAEAPADFLLLSGVPIGEPVARYGPFVMNTQQEIIQAVEDYQNGKMGKIDF